MNQEMMTIDMDVAKVMSELDAKIPASAVSERDGGGRQKLSYLETWYVIDRLNKVFGPLNWTSETVEMREMQGCQKPSYMARVRIIVALPNGKIVFKDGTGYGSDKSSLNPHEMATKEAESDALKRAAMKFGMSMGLALYDKEKENVEYEQEPKRNNSMGKTVAKKASSGTNGSEQGDVVRANAPVAIVQSSVVPAAPSAGDETAQLFGLVQSTAKVAFAKRCITPEDLKAYYGEKYGAKTSADLSPGQLAEILGYLKGLIEQ